jgi:hypothetical protein
LASADSRSRPSMDCQVAATDSHMGRRSVRNARGFRAKCCEC